MKRVLNPTGAIAAPVAAITLLLLVSACSTTPSVPYPEFQGDYTERVITQSARGIEVSAAVPSAAESHDLFKQDLYRQKIQPVWLKIVNQRSEPLTFLPVGLDPQYYSPLEAANLRNTNDAEVAPDALLNRLFLEQKITLSIAPGESLSGFIFTRLDEGTKTFNVDLAWPDDFATFTFFVPVPGLAIDHYNVNWDQLYAPDEIMELEDPALVEAIEGFACCVTDKAGENTGDPLNLVVIGHPKDVYVAFIRAGWDETEVVTRTSAWKTLRSFMSGGEYRYSPVSNLYVFDRPQDVAFQKARDNIHQRNHLRLWMSPARYQGIPVWIGQISRDIGVRFTRKTITTHKIDPDVDETREYLLEDLAYSQALRKVGYVKGVGPVSMEQPRGNLTGDPWFTDGYRLVLWVTPLPTPISALEYLGWLQPYSDQ